MAIMMRAKYLGEYKNDEDEDEDDTKMVDDDDDVGEVSDGYLRLAAWA